MGESGGWVEKMGIFGEPPKHGIDSTYFFSINFGENKWMFRVLLVNDRAFTVCPMIVCTDDAWVLNALAEICKNA